jgi:phosphonate transport system permease protein
VLSQPVGGAQRLSGGGVASSASVPRQASAKASRCRRAAGLGPFAGTLALALHTAGVLGRLFAEAIENAPPGPGDALRAQGVGKARVFAWAALPQVLPQLVSYTLYRWEINIRAAAVMGIVGAGGLGQLLSFHMGLFHMDKTATILAAMLGLVLAVDALSDALRRRLG